MYYIAANKENTNNLGEQHMFLMPLDESHAFRLNMQSAIESRLILSLTRFVERGTNTVFRKDGGTIKNRSSGRETHFERKHGVYILKAWLRTSPGVQANRDTAAASAGCARQA